MTDDTVLLKCSESLLTCQICMERFDSPRILPCQHTFCRECVLSLIRKHCLDDSPSIVKIEFPCPNCRKNCRIRTKSAEDANLLKAFPENLLLKDLLEAEEAAHETCKSSGGKKIALHVSTVEKVRDTLWRYKRILVAIQGLLRNWPSREPRICHPLQFCTDIRAKLSNFMVDLTNLPDLDKFPKVYNGGRNIRTILSRITEEERWLSNAYTLDAMRHIAVEVRDTPCCIDYIPIISPLISDMRNARAHDSSAHWAGPGMPRHRHDVNSHSTHGSEPRGGAERGMPPRDHAARADATRGQPPRADIPLDTEERVRKFLWMLVYLCATVFVLFIATVLFSR